MTLTYDSYFVPAAIVAVGVLPLSLYMGVRGWRAALGRIRRRRAAGGRPLELAKERAQLRVVR